MLVSSIFLDVLRFDAIPEEPKNCNAVAVLRFHFAEHSFRRFGFPEAWYVSPKKVHVDASNGNGPFVGAPLRAPRNDLGRTMELAHQVSQDNPDNQL